MNFDVAQRAFRVAGVKKGVRRVAGYRFAWRAQGIVQATETAGFFGPVREIGCPRARRCLSVAKSWQAQGMRGFLDVSVALCRWHWRRKRRCAVGICDQRVSLNAAGNSHFNRRI